MWVITGKQHEEERKGGGEAKEKVPNSAQATRDYLDLTWVDQALEKGKESKGVLR